MSTVWHYLSRYNWGAAKDSCWIWSCKYTWHPQLCSAIDGILIWMLNPSLKEARKISIDQKKFLYGQKHKFGLNCQAVSDCWGQSPAAKVAFLIFPSSMGDCCPIALHSELMHLGEHFNDIPQNVLQAQHWQSEVTELPWTTLFQMIVDGHWQQLTRNMRS